MLVDERKLSSVACRDFDARWPLRQALHCTPTTLGPFPGGGLPVVTEISRSLPLIWILARGCRRLRHFWRHR
jgi:hypothetical protein